MGSPAAYFADGPRQPIANAAMRVSLSQFAAPSVLPKSYQAFGAPWAFVSKSDVDLVGPVHHKYLSGYRLIAFMNRGVALRVAFRGLDQFLFLHSNSVACFHQRGQLRTFEE
jgi:hypothetical protein